MFHSSFVFQSRICPVLGFGWHTWKTQGLSLLYYIKYSVLHKAQYNMRNTESSNCHGFGIVLYVVSALNSGVIQSKACISVTKYKHQPFFLEAMLKLFSD